MNRKSLHVYHKAGTEIMPAEMAPYADHWRLLQHRILTRRWQNQTDTKTGLYTLLKWDYLAIELTPKVTGKLLEWAKSAGHVLCDGRYIEGSKALGYRLSDELENQPTIRTALSDSQLVKRIKDIDKRESKHFTKAHRHLRRWLNETSISAAALQIADHISESEAAKESNTWSIRMLMDGDFTFSRCDYGRIHTNITRLHRPLRRYLRIQGVQLVNLDIANSQPLFLGMAMLKQVEQVCPLLRSELRPSLPEYQQRRSFRFNSNSEDQADADSPTDPQQQATPPIRPQTDSFVSDKPISNQMVIRDSKKPHSGRKLVTDNDLRTYLETCCKGELYGQLMQAMQWTGTKDEFKSSCWFQFLYGSNKRSDQLAMAECENLRRINGAFKLLYPSVYQWIWDRKRTNFKRLAWEMQRAESRLMIDCVGGRLAAEHPDIPILTIHDSYLCPIRFVDIVNRIITEEFRALGITPTIGAEVYEPDEGHAEEDYIDRRAAEAA